MVCVCVALYIFRTSFLRPGWLQSRDRSRVRARAPMKFGAGGERAACHAGYVSPELPLPHVSLDARSPSRLARATDRLREERRRLHGWPSALTSGDSDAAILTSGEVSDFLQLGANARSVQRHVPSEDARRRRARWRPGRAERRPTDQA